MNKLNLPSIGFGTWRLTGREAQSATLAALGAGYRLIDTAASYGNEISIKKALKDTTVPREEFVLSGKLWNTKRQYDDAILSCKQSLKRLGVDYFDLYLVHWPASPALHENWEGINAECWEAMEFLYRDGLAKAIGVCNFLPHHLEALQKSAAIPPFVNQIELHPGFLPTETIAYCQAHNIAIEAWSPLGEGSLLQHKALLDIASSHHKTVAQVCLRWCIQHGTIPLPKSSNTDRIRQNLDVFDFILSDQDMEKIDAMPFSGGSGLDPDTITIYG